MATYRQKLLEEALLYLKMGWYLVPLYGVTSEGVCRCRRKEECGKSAGKHPCLTSWQTHASNDPKQIREWFDTGYPAERWAPNVGLVLGPRSGVIDFEWDSPAGRKFVRKICGGTIPRTPYWQSGIGAHLLFQWDRRLSTLPANVDLPGCDLKVGSGDKGSQSVLPPSLHYSGKHYTWGLHPSKQAVAKFPEKAIERLLNLTPGKDSVSVTVDQDLNWISAVEGVSEGSRNHSMTRLAGALLASCPDRDLGKISNFMEFVKVNAGNKPKLPIDELKTIWFSIEQRERAKRRGNVDGRESYVYAPVALPEIPETEGVDWIWNGFVPVASSSLLIGDWKVGKTTFLTGVLKKMHLGGEYCSELVSEADVLMVSEESEAIWRERQDAFEIGEHVHLASRPFRGNPDWNSWADFLEDIRTDVERGKFSLVVIDPWVNLNPCTDENDAAQTIRALTPLYSLMTAGAAVWLSHHGTKAAAAVGKFARGSGALPGFADVVMEFKRFDVNDSSNSLRRLSVQSRYSESPEDLVVQWTEGLGYEVVEGTTGTVKRRDIILNNLNSKWTGLEEILGWMPAGTSPKKMRVLLNQMVNKGQLLSKGRTADRKFMLDIMGLDSLNEEGQE